MDSRTARRLPDHPNGDRLYHLSDGTHLVFPCEAAYLYTEEAFLKSNGARLLRDRIPVLQRGRKIGTLPRSFDWATSKTDNFFVSLRPGDFVLHDDHWEASWSLGPGDLESIPELRRGD